MNLNDENFNKIVYLFFNNKYILIIKKFRYNYYNLINVNNSC